MASNILSPSGARIRGDDYQHLFIWCRALQAALDGSGILEIGIESPTSGNVDDLVEHYNDGKRKYYQVKASVDGRRAANFDWLTAVDKNRKSILQRFYKVWREHTKDGNHPKLELVTNRAVDPHDPIMILRDGRDGTVAARLKRAGPRSKAGHAKESLLKHLNVSEQDFFDFISCLSFRLGKLDEEWKEIARLQMTTLGLRNGAQDIQRGVDLVRNWVTVGKRRLSLEELRIEIEALNLNSEKPTPTILIQAIDHDPHPETAAVALDWVKLYQGSEPRTRRNLIDPELWNTSLRKDLKKAAQKLRILASTRVHMRGYMRLPTWFAVGVELGRTAGFNLMMSQNGIIYSSEVKPSEFSLRMVDKRAIKKESELALGLSISTDLSADVISYAKKSLPNVGRYVCIEPQMGPSNMVIGSAREALGCAFGIRDLTRNLVRKYSSSEIHLFLAMPAGAALLLGHLWDRMPDTQLYEDQGAGRGYLPSFFIAN